MNEHAEPRPDIRTIEHVWIPMPDGVRLAARVWMPVHVPSEGVPAIFEYIPYRKADLVRARDERNHPWLAQNGYVSLRVDMRGSGDSEGHMADMYTDAELDDARHVIGWIAEQDWCNGRVGMFGTSWGGTASLQASVDAPSALKATIAVCATHDRYEDDIHHMGGCLLTDTFEWGATLPAILALPPTPGSGEDWFARWKERLETLALPVANWVREEARGAYWRHGSVGKQTDRFRCPVLAVGGWSDRYSNSVMSLVNACPEKVWGIVGPWGHHYPDKGHPGPAMGFQQEALAWWDHWLKRDAAEPPNWPRLRVWLREFDPPQDALDHRNGSWVQSGPVADETHLKQFALGPENTLSQGPQSPSGPWVIESDLSHGMMSGDTGYFGRFGGLPLEQTEDDDKALVFETAVLEEDLILYGGCEIDLALEDVPQRGQLCVRLSDVSPNDISARVSFAMLNLALDDMLDAPVRGTLATSRKVKIKLPSQAYRFRPGHRIRVAFSSSYWPLVWTPPTENPITVTRGVVTLPVAPAELQELQNPLPAAIDFPVKPLGKTSAAPKLVRQQAQDQNGYLQTNLRQPLTTTFHDDIETAFSFETDARHSLHPDDPTSAQSAFTQRFVLNRPDGEAEVTSRLRVTSTQTTYDLDGEILVTWLGEELLRKPWSFVIERRLS